MELLSGWKEIADHLHLNVRTAQRWEQHGLPVRRVSASSCSPVVAIPDELELWARTRDVKADADILNYNKFIVQSALRRRTGKLLADVTSLAQEQRRLIGLIQASLPRRQPTSKNQLETKASADTVATGKPRNPPTIYSSE